MIGLFNKKHIDKMAHKKGYEVVAMFEGVDLAYTEQILSDLKSVTYSNYVLYESKSLGITLYVNGDNMTVVSSEIVKRSKALNRYRVTVINIGNDLSGLEDLLACFCPTTDKCVWRDIIDYVAVCVMRETVKNVQDRICSYCNNGQCKIRNTGVACYYA